MPFGMGHICDFEGVLVFELRARQVLYHFSHSISPVWGPFITHQLLALELLKEQVLDHWSLRERKQGSPEFFQPSSAPHPKQDGNKPS
jgi:hypothetical protein